MFVPSHAPRPECTGFGAVCPERPGVTVTNERGIRGDSSVKKSRAASWAEA